jgi:predicted esterase
VHCVVGDDDPFIKQDQLEKTKLHLDTMGIKPSWFSYPGDHRIPRTTLEKLMSQSDF